MPPVSNRLSIRYLDNFSVNDENTTNGAPVAAPESFQSESNALAPKTHQHSKEKVEQNESSNDASNETSDSENANANANANLQKPLTSRNLEAQNNENIENSDRTNGNLTMPISSTTSPPTGEDSTGKSALSTEATSTGMDSNLKPALPKKFFCKVCNQGFTRKHNMVSHEMIHTTIKLHRCTSCNLSFRRIHDLKRHEKLHTGEKPFHCMNCDRRFARPDALTRHLNSPHACSGTKDPEDSVHRTQTSNTSSSSYQASRLKESQQAAAKTNDHTRIGGSFNEEQSLPLGSESSSSSVLPTGKQPTLSDQETGAIAGSISATASRPALNGPIHGSQLGFYQSSSFSGDSNDSNSSSRPNFEINRWRSQMHKGEHVSENIVRNLIQKQAFSTTPTSANSVADEVTDVRAPKFPDHIQPSANPPQRPEPQDQQYYRSYSPYHRSSASMNSTAVLNKAVFQNHAMARNSVPEAETRPNLTKSTFGSPLSVNKGNQSGLNTPHSAKSGNLGSQAPPSYHSNLDPFVPHQPQQPQFMQNVPVMQPNTIHMNTPYNSNASGHSYLPVVPNQEGWQSASQVQPSTNIVRPGSVGRGSWSDINPIRPEGTEQKDYYNYSPEFVRAESYFELQSHANSLQMRISSLEQRMEMLEEKMKRDNKNSAKLQKRQEKKAKKKSKKSSKNSSTKSSTN
ncbi:hypothetical protein JCM33374_g5456 [Metschnikowia sp. JCM 33374]|nr:hypothetical protein JCM33374_g5456 [Metschnikowia sp. JCM 33374]